MRKAAVLLPFLLLSSIAALGQGEPKAEEPAKGLIPLRVQVLISEYDGTKKISSLPYVMEVNAGSGRSSPRSSIRVGLRVPVAVTTSKEGGSSFQYFDIGTDIDCTGHTLSDGSFRLALNVERSSLYFPQSGERQMEWLPGGALASLQPVVRQFHSRFELIIREGQTIESALATDPLSGRVQKIEVTLQAGK